MDGGVVQSEREMDAQAAWGISVEQRKIGCRARGECPLSRDRTEKVMRERFFNITRMMKFKKRSSR
jgi:hypothetical protein